MKKRTQGIFFWTITGCLWGAGLILIGYSLISYTLLISTKLLLGAN